MPFNNIVSTFCTDPGDATSTSRYYTYKNGLVRAKFIDPAVLLRPGKNICFIDGSVQSVQVTDDNTGLSLDGTEVGFPALMTASLYQTMEVGRSPVHFYLTAYATYDGGLNHGHPITGFFDAAYATIPIVSAKLDAYVAANFVNVDDDERLRGDLNVADLPVPRYFIWAQAQVH